MSGCMLPVLGHLSLAVPVYRCIIVTYDTIYQAGWVVNSDTLAWGIRFYCIVEDVLEWMTELTTYGDLIWCCGGGLVIESEIDR